MKNMFEKMKKMDDKKKIIMLLFFIFLLMFLLNYLTPLLADDYSYSVSNSYETSDHYEKLKNFGDIINFQYNHYLKWGGRSVAHFIAQIFLVLLGKNLFNVCNAIIYTFLVYFIYKNATLNQKKEKPILLIVINFLLWAYIPAFGQTILWLTGSCNYLWTTTMILGFIYLIRSQKLKDNILWCILLFLFGIITGWTNENTSFGLITILLSNLVIQKIRKKNIKKYQITSLIGTIIGFVILIAAPGNYVRSANFQDSTPFLIKIISRIVGCTNGLYSQLFPLIIFIIIAITILKYKNQKLLKYNFYIFLIGTIFSIYSMVLSPMFPSRAYFGAIVFTIIAFCELLYYVLDADKTVRYAIISFVAMYAITYSVGYMNLVMDVKELKKAWDTRIEIIETNKKQGNLNIVVDPYDSANPRSPKNGLVDIMPIPGEWPNNHIESYYDLESIQTTSSN